MGCQAGSVLRQARLRNGLDQRRLALRAGTSQDAISRIERGVENVTFDRLERLLNAMGETLALETKRLESDVDLNELADLRALGSEERLARAISWNRMAGRFAEAGRRARVEGE